MTITSEHKEIIIKSLDYYLETLVKLSAEQLAEITKVDLLNEYKRIANAREEMESHKVPEQSYRYNLDVPAYNRVICSALKCYLNDLEKSISEIDKLCGDMTVPLILTTKVRKLAKESLDEISKHPAI